MLSRYTVLLKYIFSLFKGCAWVVVLFKYNYSGTEGGRGIFHEKKNVGISWKRTTMTNYLIQY